jgi:hypothetical protein
LTLHPRDQSYKPNLLSRFEQYKFLILLLLADTVFIILHLIYIYTPYLPSMGFSLTFAGSYSEFFQYTKECWIAVLFLILAIQHRKVMYSILSLLFLYLLFDDSFEFHETFGAMVAEFFQFKPAFGLRAVDFGELAISGIFGGLFLISLFTSYLLSNATARRVARYTIFMVIVLVFFGVFLDMVEILIEDRGVSLILSTIEEGGELIVMSVITWFVFNLNAFIQKAAHNPAGEAMVTPEQQSL